MNFKKILALIMVLCMLLQGVSTLATGADLINNTDYIISDDFEIADDLSGWKAGVTNTGYNAEVTQSGGALKISTNISGYDGTNTGNGSQGYGIKTLDTSVNLDIYSKLRIKTKIKLSGNSLGEMKFNRPDSVTLPEKECEDGLYNLFKLTPDGIVLKEKGIERTLIANSLKDEWISFDIAIYTENDKNYMDIKGIIEELNGGETSFNLKKVDLTQPDRVYEFKFGEGTEKRFFDTLDTLSLTLSGGKGTIYADYLYLYKEEKASIIPAKDWTYPNESIILRASTDLLFPIDSIHFTDENKIPIPAKITQSGKQITITPESEINARECLIFFNKKDLKNSRLSLDTDVFKIKVVKNTPGKEFYKNEFSTGDELFNVSGNGEVNGSAKDTYETVKVSGSERCLATLDTNLEYNFKSNGKLVLETRFFFQPAETDSSVSFGIGDDLGFISVFNLKDGGIYTKDNQLIKESVSDKWTDLVLEFDLYKGAITFMAKETGESEFSQPVTAEMRNINLKKAVLLFENGLSSTYFDYISLKEVISATPKTDVSVIGPESNISITLTDRNNQIKFPDYSSGADIYNNEGTLIETEKVFNEKLNKVTFIQKDVLQGGEYKICFNREILSALGIDVTNDEIPFAVNSYISVDEDFQNGDISDWGLRNNYNGTKQNFELAEEGTNKFLRISFDGYHKASYAYNETVLSKKFSQGKFAVDHSQYTVLEVSLRTNSNTLTKMVKFNYPTKRIPGIDNWKDELQFNTRGVTYLNGGYVQYTTKNYVNENPRIAVQGVVESATTYELNKWYKIKTIYDHQRQKMNFYVYDENGSLLSSVTDRPMDAWWFTKDGPDATDTRPWTDIEDLSFMFRSLSAVTVTDEQLDIDDVKIYNTSAPENFLKGRIQDENGKIVNKVPDKGEVTPVFTLGTKNKLTENFYAISKLLVDNKVVDTKVDVITTAGDVYSIGKLIIPDNAVNPQIKTYIWNENLKPLGTEIYNSDTMYLHVETYGNDVTGDGSVEKPFASVYRAVQETEYAPTRGYTHGEIIVGGGTYYLTHAIETNPFNSKSQTLTIRAKEGETPVLVDGKAFKIGDAQKVTDEFTLSRLVHHSNLNEIKENLYQIDLGKMLGGISKIPKMNLPGSWSYLESNSYATADGGTLQVTETKVPACELFFNDKPMTLSRYPNDGYLVLKSEDIIEAGAQPQRWNSSPGNWDYVHPSERYATPFKIRVDRADKWKYSDQVHIFGYFYHDWADQSVPISGINPKTKIISAKYPSYYGVLDDNARQYYIYNLLEEIDSPGEYFIDRSTGLLYFYKPTNAKDTDEIIISLGNSYHINLVRDNVTVEGIKFMASRGYGIKISGNNNTIRNCIINSTASVGINVSNAKNTLIENCKIYDVNGGITMVSGDADNLIPGNSIIRNNEIYNFSRLSKTYTCAIRIQGMNNLVTHNKMYDSPHMAMTFHGVGNEISYNEIFDVLKEADDSGAIYVGRSWINRDNKIVHNYIHDIKSGDNVKYGDGMAGIYLDDHYAGMYIAKNVFANIRGRGIWDNQGREHEFSNNVFVNCFDTKSSNDVAVYSPASRETYNYFVNSGHILRITERIGTPFATKYFDKFYYYDDEDVILKTDDLIKKKDIILKDNLVIDSGENCVINGVENFVDSGNYYDHNKTHGTAFFKDAENRDYSLNLDEVRKVIPDFADVNFAEMGLLP